MQHATGASHALDATMVRHSALRALFAVLAVVSVGAMKQPAPDPSESTDLRLFQEDALDQEAMDMERALFLMAGEDHGPQSPSPGFGTQCLAIGADGGSGSSMAVGASQAKSTRSARRANQRWIQLATIGGVTEYRVKTKPVKKKKKDNGGSGSGQAVVYRT